MPGFGERGGQKVSFARRAFVRIVAALPALGAAGARAQPPRASDPGLIAANDAAIAARSQAEIIDGARRIAPLLSDVIARTAAAMRVGDKTRTLDARLVEALSEHGLAAALLGYHGFPAASAISIAPELLNAAPGDATLAEGDLVTIETSCSSPYAYATQGWTFAVGCVTDERRRLLAACDAALRAGIGRIRNGATTSEIGGAIQQTAEEAGFQTVREFGGYTMGRQRHQPPNVLNYAIPGDPGAPLPAGTIVNLYVVLITGAQGVRVGATGFGTVSPRAGEIGAVASAMVLVESDGATLLSKPLSDARDAGEGCTS